MNVRQFIYELTTSAEDEKKLVDLISKYKIDYKDDMKKLGGKLSYMRSQLRQQGKPQNFIDLCKDPVITTAYNKLYEVSVRKRPDKSLPAKYSLDTIKGRIKKKTPTSYQQFIRDVMVLGALRPSELMTINIYTKGDDYNTYYSSNFKKNKLEEEREFISLIPIPAFLRLLSRAREYITFGYAINPMLNIEKKNIKADENMNYKDLRAIGASLYASKFDSPSSKIEGGRLMLRHEDEISPAEAYLKFS